MQSRGSDTAGENGGLLGNLFPFGRGDDVPGGTSPTPITNGEAGGNVTGSPIVNLQKIGAEPVSGATFVVSSSTNFVRFVEKATGHIYEVNPESPVPQRISNTTIPKIEEIYWGIEGDELVARYLKDSILNTIYIEIIATTTTAEVDTFEGGIESTFLPTNIRGVALSPGRTQIFYLLDTANGVNGIVSNLDGTAAKNVWTSPIKNWSISWPSSSTVSLNTPPSGAVAGFLYHLNLGNGIMEKIQGNIAALSSITSSDSNTILYSSIDNANISLAIKNIENETDIQAGLNTLAEKCVFGHDGTYFICAAPKDISARDLPDSWYQGRVQFNDRIMKVSLTDGSSELLVDPEQVAGEPIDAVNLQVSGDGGHLLFTNKRDNSLWLLPIQTEDTN